MVEFYVLAINLHTAHESATGKFAEDMMYGSV
jgi:hypothetical protein